MAIDPNTVAPKHPNRRYQFGLRLLLIVVTLVGCGLGWLSFLARAAWRQQAAVAQIVHLGGKVFCDYQFDGKENKIPNATLPGPALLHSLLGDDFFRTVVAVDLSLRFVEDDDLTKLSR